MTAKRKYHRSLSLLYNTCPQCKGLKSRLAKLCMDCYKKKK